MMSEKSVSSESHHPTHHDFDIRQPEGRMNWFFYEFWPIIIPATCFLLMCAIPLTLSGALHNPFSSSDVVWGGYGLLIITEFLVALAIVCLVPRFLGIYLLGLGIYGLVFAEHFKAYKIGFVNDGLHFWLINNIAILFLTYVIIGNLVFFNALWNDKKLRKERI